MAFTREEVAEIYVATFNRAPDAAGLDWWMNDSGFTEIEDVASSFFDSDEAAVLYPAGTSSTAMVEAAYQNLFGRASDADGLAYWVDELDAGRFSQSLMLQAMIGGAKDTAEFGNDATYMANKTTIGLDFANSGQSNVDSAKSLMSKVTDDIATVESVKATIAIIADLPADNSVSNVTVTSLLSGKTVWGTDADEASGATIIGSATFSADMTSMEGDFVYGVTDTTMYINNIMDNDYNDYMSLIESNDNSVLFLTGEGELLRWYFEKAVAQEAVAGSEDSFTYQLETTNVVDTINIVEGSSNATAFDSIVNFQTNKLDGFSGPEGSVNDILNLPSSTIASDVTNFDGVDSGSIVSHTISNGWITFNNTMDNSNVTNETINDVVGYLMQNIADGDTVEGVYNGGTIVFQGGNVDTAVMLVGIQGAYLGTTAATDTILIA